MSEVMFGAKRLMNVAHAGRERLLIQLCRESGEKGLKYKSHVEKITPGPSSEAPKLHNPHRIEKGIEKRIEKGRGIVWRREDLGR